MEPQKEQPTSCDTHEDDMDNEEDQGLSTYMLKKDAQAGTYGVHQYRLKISSFNTLLRWKYQIEIFYFLTNFVNEANMLIFFRGTCIHCFPHVLRRPY